MVTRGAVTFASPQFGFTITVIDPRVTLSGTTGQLLATGVGSAPYNDQALFNLDLAAATVATDGRTQRITGIVPSLATANTAFPANYPVGAGPDRTPNTFGSFALTVTTAVTGKAGVARQGRISVRLSSAAGPSAKRTYEVRLTRKGRTVGRGTVRGRTLTVKVGKGITRLSRGAYSIAGADLPSRVPLVIG